MAWWMWMVLGIVLAVAEAMIPTNFFLLAFGVAGLLVGAFTGLGWLAAPWLEWLVFTVTSVLAVVVFQRTIARDDDGREITDLKGESATVTEDVPAGGVGRAELRGSTWSARGSAGTAIPRGTRCRVERIDGLTLWLRAE
jgi:membrane protein implicated in regulation of membrane protease activity